MSVWQNKVGFAVGTGRNGTHFIQKIMEESGRIASHHERHPMNDTFHRYCNWYGIPVDSEGFLQQKRAGIEEDLARYSFSFEASAYLSLSIATLYDQFQAKFVLLIRSPDKVVESYIHKGWYHAPYYRANPGLPPSYQASTYPHHFFGRIVPNGAAFEIWQQMTQVGKLAWYWNALNKAVLNQFAALPESHFRVIRLEDFNYDQFVVLQEFWGLETAISLKRFNAIAASKPDSFGKIRRSDTWNSIEKVEFEREVAPVASLFGYL